MKLVPMLKKSTNPKAIWNMMVRVVERKYIVFRPKFVMYIAANRVDTSIQN